MDADLRKPLVHRVFGLSREPGITDYVLGNYHWKEVTNSISDVMLGDFGIDDILQDAGHGQHEFCNRRHQTAQSLRKYSAHPVSRSF